MTPAERSVILNTSYGHFLSHFNMLVFPAVVLPLSVRLGIPLAETLQISLWMYMLLGLTALPWGWAADRWGAIRLMRIYYMGAGLSGLAAAWWIDEPLALTLALAGIGFFSGIYHPAGLGLISKTIRRLSFALGINGMFGNLGMALAPLLAGLVNWMWSPRAVYIMLGSLNLVGVLLVRKVEGSESETNGNGEEQRTGWRLAFAVLLVAMMLGGVAYRGSTVIIPAYFELKLQAIFQLLSGLLGGGVSRNLVATMITSIIFLVGMLGMYTGGRAAEKYDPRYCYLVFHAITVPAAVLIAYLSETTLIVMVFIYFFFLLGMQPVENTLLANMTPRRFHHTAFGAKFILTFGVGALAVRMIGAIEKGYGIEPVFLALAGFSALLVLTVLVLIGVTGSRSA
ncbi:MAG: MFS transporter [bacterium]|nr:MFS transporter [bacterium]MDT8284455.1 MFS transporter [Thermovirgaceae bacterium]